MVRNKAACASAGHAVIWKKIAAGPDECVVVLEHDAVMLHPIEIDITENTLDQLKISVENITNSDQSKEVKLLNKKIEDVL